jgi:hypothetical protein
MTYRVNRRGPPAEVPPKEYVYAGPPAQPFFLGPNAIEASDVIELPGAMALVNWSWHPVPPEPLFLIWGRADYEDAFGHSHFVEWCHRLILSRTGGGKMRASTIQWGPYNRTGTNDKRKQTKAALS